ncbi:MAG: Zn-ribbon domain-containing OB-fold protein [Dehalococcoidia bacterium]|nr:Zn-ribbon domain-containing OB-fold protein [Dehalococcoidia bacterium]
MADTQARSKPLPEADEASRPFYDGALAGRLMLMRCDDCGTVRLPSRRHCDRCLSTETTWVQASGRGSVRTFAVMHRVYHPGFADEVPYNIAVVELAEGPRIVSNLVGVSNADIRLGMPVEVEWERHNDVALPKFRPLTSDR